MQSLSALGHAVALLAPKASATQPTSAGIGATAATAAQGVSVQPSPARTLALSTISGALLDMKPEPTGAAKAALEFIESDDFKVSDPAVKLALADVIRYGADAFNRRFDIQAAENPKLSFDQVLTKTIGDTILANRDRFPPSEIVIGARFEDGSLGLLSIPAIGAKTSTQSALAARVAEAEAKAKAAETAGGDAGSAATALDAAGAALASWEASWLVAFKFQPEA